MIEEGADELVFLDITASHEDRAILLDVVRRTAEVCFMPLTVGGGIRSLDDIRTLLSAGADKVSINSAAVRDPELVRQAARRFGSQCIVVNIDPKRVERDGREIWEVHINGGRVPTGREAVSWAREVEELGAGEIVLTSMDADGTKNGYDLEMTRAVVDAVAVPVVASGGAGNPEHLRRFWPRRAPARPWPRAFSITGTIPSARPKNTWRAGACRSGSSTERSFALSASRSSIRELFGKSRFVNQSVD